MRECRTYPVDAATWAFHRFHQLYDDWERRERRRFERKVRAMDMAQAVANPEGQRQRIDADPFQPFQPEPSPEQRLTPEQQAQLFRISDPLFNAVDLPELPPLPASWDVQFPGDAHVE